MVVKTVVSTPKSKVTVVKMVLVRVAITTLDKVSVTMKTAVVVDVTVLSSRFSFSLRAGGTMYSL